MCCPGHQLIADGWSVLPLCWTDEAGDCACRKHHSPTNAGKAPLTRHGVNDATTDVAQVDIWSNRWPHANWGIACTGVTVVVTVKMKLIVVPVNQRVALMEQLKIVLVMVTALLSPG